MSSYLCFLILLEFTFNGECFPVSNNENEITEEWYPEAAIQYPLNSWKTLQVQIVAPNTETAEKTTQSPVIQYPGVAYPLDTGELLQLRIISPDNKEQVDLTDAEAENKTKGEITFTEPIDNATKKKYIIIKILDNNAPMDLESKYDEALSIFSRILAMERELHAELFHEHEKLLNSQLKSDLNVHVTNHDDPWKELANIFHRIGFDLEHKQDTNLQQQIEGYDTANEKSHINPGMNEQEENLKKLLETHLSLSIGGLDNKKLGKMEDQITGQADASENRYVNTEANREGDYLKDLLEKHLSLGISALAHNSETQSEQITKQSQVIQSSTSNMNRYNELLEKLLETELAHGISSALNHKEENEKYSPGSITDSSSLKTDGHQLLHDHDVNIRIEAPPPLKISTDTEHRLNLIGDAQISHVAARNAKAINLENSTQKSTEVTAESLAESEKYRRFVKKGAEFLLYMWDKLYPKTQNISLEKPSWESEKFRRFTKRGGDLLIYMWSKLPNKGRAALEIR